MEYKLTWTSEVIGSVTIEAENEKEAWLKWRYDEYGEVSTNDEFLIGDTVDINDGEYLIDEFKRVE